MGTNYKEFVPDPNSNKTPFQQYKEAANKWKIANPKKNLKQFYSEYGQVDGIPLKNRARAGEAETNPSFERKGEGTLGAETKRSNQIKQNTLTLEEMKVEAKKAFKARGITKHNGLTADQLATKQFKQLKAAIKTEKLRIKQSGKTLGHVLSPFDKNSIEMPVNWFAETGKGKGGNFSQQNEPRSITARAALGLGKSRSNTIQDILFDTQVKHPDKKVENTLKGRGKLLGGIRSRIKKTEEHFSHIFAFNGEEENENGKKHKNGNGKKRTNGNGLKVNGGGAAALQLKPNMKPLINVKSLTTTAMRGIVNLNAPIRAVDTLNTLTEMATGVNVAERTVHRAMNWDETMKQEQIDMQKRKEEQIQRNEQLKEFATKTFANVKSNVRSFRDGPLISTM